MKIRRIAVMLVAVIALMTSCDYNRVVREPNINTNTNRYADLYIRTNATWGDVKDSLMKYSLLADVEAFDKYIEQYSEGKQPQCGYYSLEPDISNRVFVNLVASGKSHKKMVEVKMTRYTPWVARNLSRQLNVDSAALYKAFTADTTMQYFQVDEASSLAMFVTFKTKMYWNASASDVVQVIEEEYDKFWNEERSSKCIETGLSKVEVMILASIVEEETQIEEDRRKVAGVYINRLRRGMPLQACPTIKYALGAFSIDRVLKEHLEVDSPYNTYKYPGLPPGPIRIPSASSIDAVLNYTHHNYYYFCASPKLDGTTVFATTFQQHSRNARAYQRELNKRKIK